MLPSFVSASTTAQSTLLRGGLLVTMDAQRRVLRGDLLVRDGRIAAIAQSLDVAADRVIDCADCIVLPGLIQPHTHLCQTLFRGGADGLELLDWLRERIWPAEAAHDAVSLYVSAMLGAAELLRSGTTAILDMATVHHTDAVFAACRDIGIRATIGKALMDRGEGVPAGLLDSTENALAESLALAERWHGAAEGRLRYAFAPRFVLSCTETLLREVVAAARRLGLGIHTHAAENRKELDAVRKLYGKDNVEYMHDIGMVAANTVMAHCIWLSEHEKDILQQTGAHVAHCPSSNLKLASGIAPVPELLRLGINVGLAADGAPCNNNLDGFQEMRLAALIQGPAAGAAALSPRAVVEMATLGGARALGLLNHIGSLECGKLADITVVAVDQPHMTPLRDPYSTLVYAARAADVTLVMVGGDMRVERGSVVGLDWPGLQQHARVLAQERFQMCD